MIARLGFQLALVLSICNRFAKAMGTKKSRKKTSKSRARGHATATLTPRKFARALGFIVAVVAAGVAAFLYFKPNPKRPSITRLPDLYELLWMSPKQRADVDIALMNLRCAEGLRGSLDLNISEALKMLDRFAGRVQRETDRQLYKFYEHRSDYQNSEAYFRMLMMAVVLQEDFKVHYNPEFAGPPDVAVPEDKFYADSKNVLINGLVGPPMTGTCSSMPVLYVAVGRRLGYPLYLVASKKHLFVRWDDGTTSLNVEATARGLATYGDDHYKSWPFNATEEEIRANGLLKSMTPEEELACFTSMRGHCLMCMGQFVKSVEAHRESCRLAPHIQAYSFDFGIAERDAKNGILALRMRQIDQVNALLDRQDELRAAGASGKNP